MALGSGAPSATIAAPGIDHSSDGDGPCTFKGEPTVVDRWVRSDTGVSLGLGVNAVGWAKAQGKPAAATFDGDGVVHVVDVADAFPALDQKPEAKTTRVVQRVVPLEIKNGQVRVAVDYLETTGDKRRRVYCGPSDGQLVSFDGPSLTAGAAGATKETIDCRTVPTDTGFGALESVLEGDGTKTTASLAIGSVVVARRETPLKPGELPSERYAFVMLGGARGSMGSVYVARFNGIGIIARRGTEVLPDVGTWQGAATNPLAVAIAADGDRVDVWNTLAGKPDLYRTPFSFPKKPDAPKAMEGVTAADERGSVSLLRRDGDTLVVAAKKSGGKREVEVLRYDDNGKLRGTSSLGDGSETVVEAKLASLPSGDVLFVYVVLGNAGYVIKSVVGACGASAVDSGTAGDAVAATSASVAPTSSSPPPTGSASAAPSATSTSP